MDKRRQAPGHGMILRATDGHLRTPIRSRLVDEGRNI